jgi:hypothetical protein
MTEGITYDPQGTVTVTFDGNTYKLRRPNFGQFRYFNRKYYGIVDDLQSRLTEAQDLLKKSREAEDPEGVERAKAMVRDLGATPLHEITTPVLAEMFTQVGDPLPEDVDDWPAWLVTDPSLMRQILDHWRTVPKASGKAKEEAASG